MRKGLSYSAAGKLGAIASKDITEQLYLQRVEKYNQNPICCKQCNGVIPYGKHWENIFCSKSCSASFVNKFREVKHYCIFCNKELKYRKIYCSRECQKELNWKKLKDDLIAKGYDESFNHHNAKRYLIELHDGTCQMCDNNEWLKKPIALVLDHINGNSGDGSLNNLRIICNNCDATTDTYKAKNKGKGRAKRMERYRAGKSY